MIELDKVDSSEQWDRIYAEILVSAAGAYHRLGLPEEVLPVDTPLDEVLTRLFQQAASGDVAAVAQAVGDVFSQWTAHAHEIEHTAELSFRMQSWIGDLETAARDHLRSGVKKADQATKPRRKPRGRPTAADPKEDERVSDAWRTGQYHTHDELAREMRLSERQVKLALDRHRKKLTAEERRG